MRQMLSDTHRFLRSLYFVGPGQCNICGNRVRFRSVTRMLGRTLAEYEFPYSLDEFETLNHRRYLCQMCGSTDRDRLYKLYLDRFLPPGATRRVVEFAPTAALGTYLRTRDDLQRRTADL